jgi:hypothetical protein
MGRLRRTENGVIVVCDPGSDKAVLEVATLRCVHCSGHWVPKPGSGIERGWCQNCAGPVCSRACAKCVPVEVYLESVEKGIPPDQVRRFTPANSSPEQARSELFLPTSRGEDV